MSDTMPNDFLPLSPSPACPVCGGETFLAPMHKAVEKVLSVFRCRRCDVEYPVVRKVADHGS